MNGLLSNARLAFLRPANPRDYAHTVSRIIGAILPVTIASTLFRHRSYVRFPLRLSHHQPVSYTPFSGSLSYGSFQRDNAFNVAAWEARPPGPDSWAGSAVRRIIAPVTMAATGARAAGGREGKAMGAQRMHAPTILL